MEAILSIFGLGDSERTQRINRWKTEVEPRMRRKLERAMQHHGVSSKEAMEISREMDLLEQRAYQ